MTKPLRAESAQLVFLPFVPITLLAALCLPSSVFAELSSSVNPIAPFQLSGTDDKQLQVDPRTAEYHVLCFMGCECPLARVYAGRLQAMSDRYADRGVRFVGINSNIQDSMDDVREFVAEHNVEFSIGKDFDRSVAVEIGATRTPEVFVVDRKGIIQYRGRIDDQYQPGIARREPSVHDLSNAIDALLNGKPIAKARTKAVGCLISLPKKKVNPNSSVTYCDQVARVLQRNCIECHREGEIGPFALEEYDEVIGWGDMMIEVIDEARMPPWHASPDHGDFKNARQMSSEDKQTLKTWVDAGMPYGNVADLPEPIEYTTGWRLPRQPDLVLDMNKHGFQVPADGTVEYQYYVVDPKLTEDKWIRAAQIIPGNRSVVHHCIAFIRPPDGAAFNGVGLVAAYVPGQINAPLPKGYARKIEAGSKIVLQMHYTPTGKPQNDKTQLGVVFAKESDVTHEVFAVGGLQQDFEIPPNDASFSVDGEIYGWPGNGELLSAMPHMHLRGKSFELLADTHGGDEKRLLVVPAYDFNWQHNYAFADSVPLSDVKRLRFRATFDNSSDNPTNPDPEEYVTWGDQTWQEMAVAFLAVARPRKPRGDQSERTAKEIAELDAEIKAKVAERQKKRDAAVKEYVDKYMDKMDRNRNGYISINELPDIVRMYYRWSLDRNQDEVITREELTEFASNNLGFGE